MGRKTVYFCDCCNKEVETNIILNDIMLPELSWEGDVNWNDYEVCNDCYIKYEAEMFKIKRMMNFKK